MIDEINEPIDIAVPVFNDENEDRKCIADDHHSLQEIEKRLSMIRISEHRLDAARPLYFIHKRDMKMVQQKFKQQNRCIVNTYKSNAMYSCTNSEFKTNISTFFAQTNVYSLNEKLNGSNPNCVRKHLDDLVDKVKLLLDHLLQQQSINSMQYHEMEVQRSQVRLDYLFFLLDTHRNKISVQPMMVSCASPFSSISRLLHRLLQPTYDRPTSMTPFSKNVDAILALEKYTKRGRLRSTTLFAVPRVPSILITFNHEQAINVLERFLRDHVSSKQQQHQQQHIPGLSIPTIIEFIRLLLDNQSFVSAK